MPLTLKEAIPSKRLKARLFSSGKELDLEQELNSWLHDNDFKILDLIYQHSIQLPHQTYSCMVIYTE
jgi:hypothetical protein